MNYLTGPMLKLFVSYAVVKCDVEVVMALKSIFTLEFGHNNY